MPPRFKPSQPPRAAALVADACRTLETAEREPSLAALAAQAGLSASHFHRLFVAATGLTPKQYAAAHRATRVRRALAAGASVTEAIHEAGYGGTARFYENAKAILGMHASDVRRGGRAQTISFAVGQSSLGAVLVAATEKGLCAVSLDDDPDELVRALQDKFPDAVLNGGDANFERLVATVVGLVENPAAGADLPLDVQGTAFQHRVWQALRRIPPGKTLTYTELAARIGAPAAVRAVARACASNQIAVAIPCHRVVRLDGGLAGYRWGVERKEALLRREKRRE